MKSYLGLAAGLAVLAGCQARHPTQGQGPTLGDGTIENLTPAAASTASSFRAPLDAALSSDGKTAYFIALQGDGAAVFRAPAPSTGTPVVLLSGAPLVSPFGLDVSSDGSTLVIADAAAVTDPSSDGLGALWLLSTSGGAASLLSGTEGYRPRGVVVHPTASGDLAYFSGKAPDDGAAGVFSVPLGGGLVTVVAQGEPLVDPSGVAVAADGTVYAADVGDPDGRSARVLRLGHGSVEPFLDHLATGYPAGVALSQDEQTLLVSARRPDTGTDAVLRASVAGGKPELVSAGIDTFEEPAGLHRARSADTFAWADSAANGGGTVYVINKQP